MRAHLAKIIVFIVGIITVLTVAAIIFVVRIIVIVVILHLGRDGWKCRGSLCRSHKDGTSDRRGGDYCALCLLHLRGRGR